MAESVVWPIVVTLLVLVALVSAMVVMRSRRGGRPDVGDGFAVGGKAGRQRELMDLYRAAQQAEDAGHPEAAQQVREAIKRLEADGSSDEKPERPRPTSPDQSQP